MLSYFNTSHVKVYHGKYIVEQAQHSYFNTSHVKVYRQCIQCWKWRYGYFNTSHVKVYPSFSGKLLPFIFISIHPMLKFILMRLQPCSSLSPISIHPMLKFISQAVKNCLHLCPISIHPMLKFIQSCRLRPDSVAYFNTSHVKVYPTHFLYFIQSTISDFSVFINILKIFTSRRALCQKN